MNNHARRAVLLLLPFAVVACGFPKTGPAPPPLTPDEVRSAAMTSPASTEQSLTAGHDTFVAKCNGCHGYPDLASTSAASWPDVMRRMAKKAALTDAESTNTLHFVLVARKEPAGSVR